MFRRSIELAILVLVAITFAPTGAYAEVDFGPPKTYAVGTNPAAVLVGDFNGDGRADLAVANAGSGNVSILLGNGDGTFQPAKDFNVGDVPNSLVAGDFNGDHKLDLVVGSSNNATLLLGNGDGTFAAPVKMNVDASTVLAADINLDGKLDLITKGGLLMGNGDGTFQPVKDVGAGAVVLIADFNGDGNPDLLNSSGVLLGNGDATFRALIKLPSLGCTKFASCIYVEFSGAVDFNGDKKLDLAAVVSRKGLDQPNPDISIVTLFGNGDGSFQSPVRTGQLGLLVATADFNGDGKPDLVSMPTIGQDSPLVFLSLGKGDGSFPSTFSFDTGSGPNFLLVADLNGDKLPDLITTDPDPDNSVTVMLNTSPNSGADLSVQISATPEPVSVTQQLTYTVQAINSGPEDATNVTLKNTLPSGMNFVSATISQSSCTQASLVVTCMLSKFVSGDSATLKMVVVPSATGTATDTANISGTEPDPTGGNNSATRSTRVDPMFTLAVTKSGAGTGVVSDDGGTLGNFNCGSTCSVSLPTGTTVSIFATPDSSSVFGGWGQACSPSVLANECDLTMNANQNVTAAFDKGPNFFLSADASSLTVARGGAVSTNITIIPEVGATDSFNNPIALSCSIAGPAPMPSCSLSSASVTPGSNQTGSILKITAPTQSTAVGRMKLPRSPSMTSRTWLLTMVMILMGLVVAFTRSMPQRQAFFVLYCLLFTVTVSAIGCGGGSRPVMPKAQSYSVTVTATSGAITKTAQISLTVN